MFWTIRSFPEKKQMFYYFYGSLFCQLCSIDKFKQQLCDIRGDSSDWFMAYFFIILQGNWSALFQSRTTFKRFVSSNKWLLSKQIIYSFFPTSFFLLFFPHNVCGWQDTKDQTIFIRPLILWKISSLTVQRMRVSMHVFKRAQIPHFIRSDNKLCANA